MKNSFMAIIGGVLVLVVGLVLSTVILDRADASGVDVNIGSFAGARALNDLIPLMYYAVLVLFSVGLMSLGGAGLAGKGPMGGR